MGAAAVLSRTKYDFSSVSLPSDERQNSGKPGPNLILLGPPGAGKGSLATGLASLDIEHVSSGEIFRTEIATGSQLGREFEKVLKTGSLVSDEQTLAVVRKWYFARKRNRGFLIEDRKSTRLNS